jgi:hypothetical protein
VPERECIRPRRNRLPHNCGSTVHHRLIRRARFNHSRKHVTINRLQMQRAPELRNSRLTRRAAARSRAENHGGSEDTNKCVHSDISLSRQRVSYSGHTPP